MVPNPIRIAIAFGITVVACATILLIGGVLDAGEVRLKNGLVLSGNVWVTDELGKPPIPFDKMPNVQGKNGTPVPRNIVLIDNGWQRFYVPRSQILPDGIKLDVEASKPYSVEIPQLKSSQSKLVASAGSVISVTPFDDHGRRTISLAAAGDPLNVIQAIRRMEPDHVILEALNYKWQIGVSSKSIPVDTVKTLLRQKINTSDPAARLNLVNFYIRAELYQQAFEELDAIRRDFPEARTESMHFRFWTLYLESSL